MSEKNEIEKAVKHFEGRVVDFLLKDMAQDATPDSQRLEVEEVARVIVTPTEVEIYTFDDRVFVVTFGSTKVTKMKLTPQGMFAEEETATQQHRKPVVQQFLPIE